MRMLLSIAAAAVVAWSQPSNPTFPLDRLTPGGAPILLEASAATSGPVLTKQVKLDSTVQRTTAPDGSILITAVPLPPAPTVINQVLWATTKAATTQPPAQQLWCITTTLVPNWSPVAIVESRVSAGGAPVSFNMFYLISFPGQAQGAPTTDGVTWTRTNSLCSGGPAIAYTPASLPATDQRIQVFVMVTGS